MTNFAISKWSRRINKLIFSSALRQRLASTTTQIVSVNNLCKKLSLAYNLNASSLKAHLQEIVIILQEIFISALLKLLVYKVSNQYSKSSVQSKILVYEVPHQLKSSAQSRLPVYGTPNQYILLPLSGIVIYEVFNQPT